MTDLDGKNAQKHIYRMYIKSKRRHDRPKEKKKQKQTLKRE